MHNAVEGEHDEHPDHAPDHVLPPLLPRLFIARILDHLKHAVEELDGRQGEEKRDDWINDLPLDILE